MYKLYDCVNGYWFNQQEYSREEAEAYLLRHKDDPAFIDGDYYFAPADSAGDYDGDVIELQDLI
jgi:hypothetical protein